MISPTASGFVESSGELSAVTRRRLFDLVDTPGIQVVVLGISKDPNAKTVVLFIPPGSATPTLAAKVPTTDVAAAAVERERHLLEALHHLGPRGVLATIPAIVDMVDFGGRPALVMSALQGHPMTTMYHHWRHTAHPAAVASDFAAVGAWLARFQEKAVGPPSPIDMDGGTTALFRERFADCPDVAEALDALARIQAGLRRYATPRTWVHGDLWAGNILMADGKISGIVDWEAGAASGEPVRDLVRFALAYALYLDRHTTGGRRVPGHPGLRAGRWGAGIAYAIDGASWFPDLFRRFLSAGLVRLGVPPGCWRDAALCGIAEVAAIADDLEFARRHFELFRQLVAAPPARGKGE